MDEKNEFTRYFRESQLKFPRLYTIILTKMDITLPQYALLNQLMASEAMPMTQASKELHISKPAVTNLVDRLEKNKCIKRLPHPKDRRVYLLQIQPKGEKMVRRIQTYVLHILLKTLTQFSPAEKRTINRFYACLSETMGEVLIHPKRI